MIQCSRATFCWNNTRYVVASIQPSILEFCRIRMQYTNNSCLFQAQLVSAVRTALEPSAGPLLMAVGSRLAARVCDGFSFCR